MRAALFNPRSTKLNVAELRIPEKGTNEMFTTLLTVSPDQAQQWLDGMPSQRRLRKAKVEQLRRQIVDGRWKVLPHGIVFDTEGKLIDGQHRMTALVQAGKPLPVRCTFNVDPGLFLQIDADTAPKTLEDMLKHEGVPAGLTTIISEPVRMLYREELGRAPNDPVNRPTNAEGLEVFRRNARLVEAGEMASRCRLAPSRALLAYVLYKGILHDETMTRLFVDQLARGEGLRAGDPALLLRNSWMQDRASRVVRGRSDMLIMAMTALRDSINGKRRSSWRGVEFGKGKIPSLERPSLV